MPSDPRHLLERLLGPEGVGRDPGGLARAFPDTPESLAEVLALVAREGWRVRLEGRGSWLAADAPGDLAISTKALDEVTRVDLVKGTVTLGAGTSLEVGARRRCSSGASSRPATGTSSSSMATRRGATPSPSERPGSSPR